MLTPLSERQKTLIVNNVVKATKDITKLNKTGYNFLYRASGFIAHYDIYGFIRHYQDDDLANDILENQKANLWNNFKPGDQDYDYMMAKKDVYQRILTAI
jgi:hypothetical protein